MAVTVRKALEVKEIKCTGIEAVIRTTIYQDKGWEVELIPAMPLMPYSSEPVKVTKKFKF